MRTLLKRSAYTVLLTAALLATWGENTAVADEFPPREILMVSNGYYYQEYQIIQHIEDLDSSNLTTVADYEMDGNTDLDHYDLIILTGFAPNLSNANIQSISDSAVPVLLVEFWDFIYSYKLGLTNDDFGYFGDDLLDVAERDHPITQSLPDDLGYYDPPYFAFGVGEWALSAGTTALLQGSTWDQVSVFVDDTRKIAATGLSETAFYTESAWLLFDMLCHYLAPVLPEWEGAEGLSYAYEASGLKSFIEYLQNNPGSYTDQEVTDYVYRTLFKWNLFDLSAIIEIILRQAGVPIQIAPLYVFINDLPKIHNTAHDVRRMQDTDRCDDVHCEKDRSFLGENLTDNTSAACKVVDVGVDISKLPDNWDEMSEQDQADFICDPENADVLIKEERCGRDTYTPNAETHEIVYGTDVGMSVRTLNGVTIFHMGDSGSEVNDNTDWGNPSLQLGCRSDIPEACNDPMMILNDSDGPENGIDADLLLHDETPSAWFDSITTYRPLLIPGVNQEPVFSDSPDIIKWFGYATGAESAIAGAINYNPFPWSSNPTTIALHVPYVYLWYATAVAGTANNNPANVNSVARSYLACSVDGIEFHNCLGHTGADDVATLFSTNKFVIVSPVRITTDLWQECDTSDERSLCDLKATLEADDPENT
ncbi:MAG: hypothetical protein GY866_16660, partial [Proteobacteria bacterium]|nr:hypothetical protein [Pseudomonadota bacterium]